MVRPGVGEHVEEGDDAGEEEDTEVVLELHRRVQGVAVTTLVQKVRHDTELSRRYINAEPLALHVERDRGDVGRT